MLREVTQGYDKVTVTSGNIISFPSGNILFYRFLHQIEIFSLQSQIAEFVRRIK